MFQESPGLDNNDEQLSLEALLRKKLDLLDLKEREDIYVQDTVPVETAILDSDNEQESTQPKTDNPNLLDYRLPNSPEPIFSEESEDMSFIRSDIYEMLEPAKLIWKQIREKVERGEYGMIIGEDASGRLPTLLFRHIIDSVNKKNGLAEIPTRFIAGSSTVDQDNSNDIFYLRRKKWLSEVIDQLEKQIQGHKKLLLITDTIATGRSLSSLIEVLRERDIGFDIVTLSTLEDWKGERAGKTAAEAKLGTKIISGEYKNLLKIYRNDYSGVSKDNYGYPIAERLIRYSKPSEYKIYAREAPQPLGFFSGDSLDVDQMSEDEKNRYFADLHEDPRVKIHTQKRMRIAREIINELADEILQEDSQDGEFPEGLE